MTKKATAKPIPSAFASNEEARERIAKLKAENEAAEATLQKACNNAERWERLKQQAQAQGIGPESFTALCGKMLRTRREWSELKNDAARELAAFHGLLVTLGSLVTAKDEEAFHQANAPA